MPRCLSPIGAALAALTFCLPGTAQVASTALEGNYSLVSSTTAPVSNWGYSKARITIKKLDDRHLLIVLACEWKREPKAVCGEHHFAQWQESGLYIDDMNTDWMRIYFDPATRTLSWVSRGADARESVRRDMYRADDSALTDTALIRRMKRETANAMHKESMRVFGPPSKRSYQNNQIEFQRKP